MYDLPYHKEQNEQVIKELIDQHSFAFLAGSDSENKPVATQVPVFIEKGWQENIKGTYHEKYRSS